MFSTSAGEALPVRILANSLWTNSSVFIIFSSIASRASCRVMPERLETPLRYVNSTDIAHRRRRHALGEQHLFRACHEGLCRFACQARPQRRRTTPLADRTAQRQGYRL